MLNVDYKIASRSISARLLKVLHFLVGKDQTCGVPGHVSRLRLSKISHLL